MPTEDRPITRPQRIARRQRLDAERQSTRRKTMAVERRPDTHAVDRALAEALAYVAIQNHSPAATKKDIMVPFRDVLEVAGRILACRGRYDAEKAVRAIVDRTKDRKGHLWTLPAPERPDA